ncbi:MAG TPA: ABC transporter permease subunit [Anaerolineales bacterium]|nr:ABC transporter permease subunit [Anaerolineales bacterium]
MSANTLTLVPRQSHGWRMGLANMLAKENFAWWRTRRWWIQILVAALILNGSLALNLGDHQGVYIDLEAINFLMTSSLFVPIIVVILAQDAILSERHSGTTAWVLSKPLQRPAFIFSKLIAYGLGFFVTWVLIPNIIFYFQLVAAGREGLSIPGFIGLIGLSFLNLLFYMTLALMLATIFNNRAPGLGISILIAWAGPMQFIAQPIEKFVPWLYDILPWKLMSGVGEPPLAGYLALGAKLPTVLPIIATLLWCVLFVVVSIWRTGREEF